MGILEDKFGVPPFSILDTKQKYWVDRKKEWLSLGIKSEVGREGFAEDLWKNQEWLEEHGKGGKNTSGSGVSVFDPVVCELSYKWFCPPHGSILDPFAGGSVRGMVASKLGYTYTGIDLREEQMKANIENFNEIDNLQTKPRWIMGDSANIDKLIDGKYDFLFSCPPYHDLEKYGNDPNDLSNMSYADFKEKYREIIKKSVHLLKLNRFAVFIVGEIRGEDGFYKNFVHETISMFLETGMKFYNDIVLVAPVASMSLRVDKQFTPTRKIGKIHQNMLVFFQGDVSVLESLKNNPKFFTPLNEMKCDKVTIDPNEVIIPPTTITCEVCGVTSKDQADYDAHLSRRFHQDRMG